MQRLTRRAMAALGLAVIMGTAMPEEADAQTNQAQDLENTLYLDLQYGRVVIRLRPDLAPRHVARVKELTRRGFYDGIVFHRVIAGFMAQTGDPTGTGSGGSGQTLQAEFSREPFRRGTIGAARTRDPNSADSQFFICFAEAPHLNGQYTVWGQVVQGMEHVDRIQRGEPPRNPDRIVRMQVAVDARS
jgi:cyclophilin family peptidyl-prolyl cis-trans isomerase